MSVHRLADGLWRWTVPHPEWREGADWERYVGCVYCESPDAVVLIDPLVPAGGEDRERFWRALDRDVDRLGVPVIVALTCWWHERSAHEVTERYPGVAVWSPTADISGVDASTVRVVDELSEVAPGVVAYPLATPDLRVESFYWLANHRALVTGDILLGDASEQGVRVAPASWFEHSDAEREWYRNRRKNLGGFLDLDIEAILVSHGEPVLTGGREALRAALDSA
jgi:glyoxylase-like metal-dependent hydrolase (beta-lactamase superfamily II)